MLQRPCTTTAGRGRSPGDQRPAHGRDSREGCRYGQPTDVNHIWSFSAQMSPCFFVAPGLFIWAPQAVADGLFKGPAELPVCCVSMVDVT